jgi:hypothetical protein
MKTENSFINVSFSPRISQKRKNRHKRLVDNIRFCKDKLLRDCQAVIASLSVAVFATTIFLGGSYLFFVQLAEYGW